MQRRRLTELAVNPDLISGIYNYCDRWCERCSFTSRCLLYATEQEDDDGLPESCETDNAAFWLRLNSIFQDAQHMLREWAEEQGIDLTTLIDGAGVIRSERRLNDATAHPLAVAGQDYASAVSDWFNEVSNSIGSAEDALANTDDELGEQIRQASEVIHWYQFQIAVKTIRALSSRGDEEDPDGWTTAESLAKDSDGSAKVALLGVDRSIGAWRLMQLSLPERAEMITPLLVQLERLRNATEREFPAARDFIRPGFDEIVGLAN